MRRSDVCEESNRLVFVYVSDTGPGLTNSLFVVRPRDDSVDAAPAGHGQAREQAIDEPRPMLLTRLSVAARLSPVIGIGRDR